MFRVLAAYPFPTKMAGKTLDDLSDYLKAADESLAHAVGSPAEWSGNFVDKDPPLRELGWTTETCRQAVTMRKQLQAAKVKGVRSYLREN